ncbi:hypothetical protein [Chromobacterium amazonense]|uniref:Secreted protein n=1 Tax=Chromobacterium amazonense TaxID=1382803 RepID=A0ABU8V084_9NEIS|nr:hypothetical protein [Chromobacterium amazonense]MDE1714544.1 hypothetical protein [Chromobacterium amazonense]
MGTALRQRLAVFACMGLRLLAELCCKKFTTAQGCCFLTAQLDALRLGEWLSYQAFADDDVVFLVILQALNRLIFVFSQRQSYIGNSDRRNIPSAHKCPGQRPKPMSQQDKIN